MLAFIHVRSTGSYTLDARRTRRTRSSAAGRSITTIARTAPRLRSPFGNDFHPMVPDSLKGFQPDFREQSELVHSHFVAARAAFSLAAPFPPFSCPPPRSLKRNAKRKFRTKNEYVDKGKFTGSGKSSAPFLSSSSLFGLLVTLRNTNAISRKCELTSVSLIGTKLSNLLVEKIYGLD